MMLLFARHDRVAVRAGKITVAFRNWDIPRVLPGKKYRAHDLGVVFVEKVDRMPVASINEQDAMAAGARSLKGFLSTYMRRHPFCNPRLDQCVRIQFRYVGADGNNARLANETHLTHEELQHLHQELQSIDGRTTSDGVATELLGILAREEWGTSRGLADAINLNTDQVKRRMLYLKRLGLIESCGQRGYRLTPRGMRLYTFQVTGK